MIREEVKNDRERKCLKRGLDSAMHEAVTSSAHEDTLSCDDIDTCRCSVTVT